MGIRSCWPPRVGIFKSQELNWNVDKDVLTTLLTKKQLQQLGHETATLIRSTIVDAEARQPLYRAKLSTEPLSLASFSKLASVPPEIHRVREHIDSLIGPWLRPEVNETLATSPLVREVPDEYLDSEERKGCHWVLAKIALETRRNQWGLLSAITHFVGAEQHNQACALLTHALLDLLALDTVPPGADLFLEVATEGAFSKVSADNRLVLAAAQLSARQKFDRSIESQVAEIEELLPQASAASSVPAASLAFRALFKHRPPLAAAMWRKARTGWETFTSHAEIALELRGASAVDALVWLSAPEVRTLEQFDLWVDMVAGLSTEAISLKGNTVDPLEALGLPVNSIWLLEAQKVSPEWQAVLCSLRRIHAVPGSPQALCARAIRAEITVLADHLRHLPEAEQLAKVALERQDWKPEHRYLIAEGLGRQLLFAGKYEESFHTIELALADACESSKVEALELATTLRAAAVAAVRLQSPAAADYAREAIHVIKRDKRLPELEVIRNLGEAGLIAYLARDTALAYQYLNEAALRYLEIPPSQRGDLAAALGRVVEHTYHLAKTGAPLDPAKLGLERGEPQPDIFYQKASNLSPVLTTIISIRLCVIAENVGRENDAVGWAMRACAEAYENPSEQASRYLFVALHYVSLSETEDALDVYCRELAAAASVEDPQFQEALLLAVVFWLLRVARDCEVDRGAGLESAVQLAAACRSFAEDTPCPERWRDTADLIAHPARGGSYKTMIHRSNTLRAAGMTGMALLAVTAALIAEDLEPHVAVQLQMAALDGFPSEISSMFTHRIAFGYLVSYWRKVAETQGFRLTRPQAFRDELLVAAKRPSWATCIATLVSAADAVGVRVSPAWRARHASD